MRIAESRANTIAPTIGERLGTILVADKYRAKPIPPRTAWLIAPAKPAIRFTVTTLPRIPKRTELRIPAKRAFRIKGISGEKRISKNPLMKASPGGTHSNQQGFQRR